MARRLAVIDVGSNTLHLLVADCDAPRVAAVHDLRLQSGLGAVVSTTGAIGDKRLKAAAVAVRRFAAQARRFGAEDMLLVATEAVRAAADRRTVIRELEAAARTRMHLLSPEQEAILCLAGAGLEPLPAPPFLLADIGGGSCDLAVVGVDGVVAARTLAIGSGVLAARCLAGDPPSRAWIEGADAVARSMVADAGFGEAATFPEIVVTGGAGRRLRRQCGLPPHAIAGSSTIRLLPRIERLLAEPAAVWHHPIQNQERAAVVRGGAVLLRALLLRWQIPAWRASSYGLREGALRLHAQGGRLHDLAPARGMVGLARGA